MEMKHYKITIRELTDGYEHCDDDDSVIGYGGKLNIRPSYQREFVYKPEQQNRVIDSVLKGRPLNMMYWAICDDGTYEIIDGQQRTLSICQFVNGDFFYKPRNSKNTKDFDGLSLNEQEKILNYELDIIVCNGDDNEKLEWFEIINIPGKCLTAQELRNAVYHGPWVSDAKTYFSKNTCPAFKKGKDYVNGTPINQDYLETAIKWALKGSNNPKDSIEKYMAKHKNNPDAEALWKYFKQVINWVKLTFPVKRPEYMKHVDWGDLYSKFKDKDCDAEVLEKRIAELVDDYNITEKNKKGIYPYVLDGDKRHLYDRNFSTSMKRKVYKKQNGICKTCGEKKDFEDTEADHKYPWIKGGPTIEENCQVLCIPCNRKKAGK